MPRYEHPNAPSPTPEPRDPSKPRSKSVPEKSQPYEGAILKSNSPTPTSEEWKSAYKSEASCNNLAHVLFNKNIEKTVGEEISDSTFGQIEAFANNEFPSQK